jgi:predicted hydrolase (HD superfamily)
MKDKAFARGCNREDIVSGSAALGIDLPEHIQFVLDAMRARSDMLGLGGLAPTSA